MIVLVLIIIFVFFIIYLYSSMQASKRKRKLYLEKKEQQRRENKRILEEKITTLEDSIIFLEHKKLDYLSAIKTSDSETEKTDIKKEIVLLEYNIKKAKEEIKNINYKQKKSFG